METTTHQLPDVAERFMRYVQIDSQSDPEHDDVTPSTPRQHEMARYLGEELTSLGCTDVTVDEHAYVTGTFPASPDAQSAPALMLCSHLDSVIDAPAAGIKPHIVHYEGGNLVAGVVAGEKIETTPEQVPDLEKFVGMDIVCSDGSTLLSADDKAGVAEICALLKRLSDNPELKHPTLKIAFVPDEEIGHGAALLDLKKLGAAYGSTVDGEAMVHPGSAKDVMVNAITVASEFQQMVPAFERPEHTEGREGFYHPINIEGSASEVKLSYIIRDFDSDIFDRREQTLRDIAAFLNTRYGENTVHIEIHQQYRNMAEKFKGYEFLIDYALAANREVGIEPNPVPARGGTDGAQLTFRGLPCPNIATGGYNAHSIREFIPVPSMEVTVDLLVALVAKFADRADC